LSQQYKKYINACGELEFCDLSQLNDSQRVAFFLNVYQCMYVHFFLKQQGEDGDEDKAEAAGWFSKVSNYMFNQTQTSFYYNIAGCNFTLDEMKHGLLRGNRKSPFSYMRSLNTTD